ncbi:MAG: hypothetical protein AAB957_00620 [Patescibacteria group bacterium]
MTIKKNYVAAFLSLVAGLIHAVVIIEHFEEWWGYGMFFVVVTIYQLFLAYILFTTHSPSHAVLWVGIIVNIAIIVLWIYTRTLGVPFGPETGEVESIGTLDTISKLAELGTILFLAMLFRSRHES